MKKCTSILGLALAMIGGTGAIQAANAGKIDHQYWRNLSKGYYFYFSKGQSSVPSKRLWLSVKHPETPGYFTKEEDSNRQVPNRKFCLVIDNGDVLAWGKAWAKGDVEGIDVGAGDVPKYVITAIQSAGDCVRAAK